MKTFVPGNSKRTDCGAGNISFASILDTNALPNLTSLISRLDEGEGVLNALTAHCGKWHKPSQSFFCQREVDREGKRSKPDNADNAENITELFDFVDSPLKRRNTRSVCGPTVDVGNSSV